MGWIAPELTGGALRMRADLSDQSGESRTWAGFVDEATFKRSADVWRLDATPYKPAVGVVAEAGGLTVREYTLDGMNWEMGGMSPIVYVSVWVSEMRGPHGPEVDNSWGARTHG